jgi:hypothetical protein
LTKNFLNFIRLTICETRVDSFHEWQNITRLQPFTAKCYWKQNLKFSHIASVASLFISNQTNGDFWKKFLIQCLSRCPTSSNDTNLKFARRWPTLSEVTQTHGIRILLIFVYIIIWIKRKAFLKFTLSKINKQKFVWLNSHSHEVIKAFNSNLRYFFDWIVT